MAFLGQSSRFLKPAHVGDTLYPMLTITAVETGRTTSVLVRGVTIHDQERKSWKPSIALSGAGSPEEASWHIGSTTST